MRPHSNQFRSSPHTRRGVQTLETQCSSDARPISFTGGELPGPASTRNVGVELARSTEDRRSMHYMGYVGLAHNGIVEAEELACQRIDAGCNSYRSSIGKVVDGLAA